VNTKPYLFLFFLVGVLVFILGVRYGQRIEKNNKVVDYLLKITPTKIPPTPTPIKYLKYKNITYPAGLEIVVDTTSSAIFFNVKN